MAHADAGNSANRTADIVRDYTTRRVFDYRRKKRVEHAEIPVPTAMANSDINWARNREELCNAAEVAEDRYNSRVARE